MLVFVGLVFFALNGLNALEDVVDPKNGNPGFIGLLNFLIILITQNCYEHQI